MIISIDASADVCSVALHNKGVLIFANEIVAQKSAADLITVFINRIVKDTGISLNELDAIAVAKGPGSYTGLRIATSTAKGLCVALNKPLISVNTLLAMCNGVSKGVINSSYLFCPMLDARRMEVYCAIYNSQLQEVLPTQALVLESNSFEKFKSNNLLLFGSGSAKCKSLFGQDENHNIHFLDNIYPSARAMGEVAYDKFLDHQFEDVAYFEPFYLKEFVSTSKLP